MKKFILALVFTSLLANGSSASETAPSVVEAAEIARLSALPPINVALKDVEVSTVLKSIADRSAMNFTAVDLQEIVSLNVKGSPWQLLQQMVEMDWIRLAYEDAMWKVRSGRVPEAKTYAFRFVGCALGSTAEPAAVSDVRKIVDAFAPVGTRLASSVVYSPDSNVLLVVATHSVQLAVERYLAKVDRPKTNSTYTVSIAGQKFQAEGVDEAEIVMESVQSSLLMDELPAVGNCARRWAARKVEVGTTIRLQRVGSFTFYRIKSSRVVGTNTSTGVETPAIAVQEVSGAFRGDEADVTLSVGKIAVSKRFLFLRWNSTKTVPAIKARICRANSRTNEAVTRSVTLLRDLPMFGLAFASRGTSP